MYTYMHISHTYACVYFDICISVRTEHAGLQSGALFVRLVNACTRIVHKKTNKQQTKIGGVLDASAGGEDAVGAETRLDRPSRSPLRGLRAEGYGGHGDYCYRSALA